jgi:hypothetical protein
MGDQYGQKVRFGLQTETHHLLDDSLNFNTSKEAFTPSINRVKYKNLKERENSCLAPPSTLTRPNYEDILRRVSVVVHQHITKCEVWMSRLTPENREKGLFHESKMKKFEESNFSAKQFVYRFVRAPPVSRMGFTYSFSEHVKEYITPNIHEVHTFLENLFVRAQLSAECSIGWSKYSSRKHF